MGTRGKGEGSLYKDAEGRWCGAVSLPADPVTGRRRRKVVRARSKPEALRKLRAVQLEFARTGDLPTSGAMTVSEWVERWIRQDVAPARKPSTTRDYRTALRLHIDPVIGRRRLDRLTADDVRAVHRHVLACGDSPGTAAKVHRVLRAALAAAEREGHVLRNVGRLVKAPPARAGAGTALTSDQARALLASCEGSADLARWMVALLMGVRQGEALGLQVDHLHLDAPVPWVDLAWELRRVLWEHGCAPDDDGVWPCGRSRAGSCPERTAPVPPALEAEQVHGGLWLLRPKTVGSTRRVAVPARLAGVLRTHLEQSCPRRFVFEAAPGVPVDPRRDWQAWKDALARAGLPAVRLHDARHTAGTLLLEEGVPARTAQEILGHTQAVTTAIYQHPSLTTQAQALDALAGRLG